MTTILDAAIPETTETPIADAIVADAAPVTDEALIATIPSGENNTDTAVVAEATSTKAVSEVTPIALTPTLEEQQAEADKAAIYASANVHFGQIYKEKVIDKHNKIANIIAEIVKNTERLTNWTRLEMDALFARVESEI